MMATTESSTNLSRLEVATLRECALAACKKQPVPTNELDSQLVQENDPVEVISSESYSDITCHTVPSDVSGLVTVCNDVHEQAADHLDEQVLESSREEHNHVNVLFNVSTSPVQVQHNSTTSDPVVGEPLNNGLMPIYCHPAYKTLIQELAFYKEKADSLQSDVGELTTKCQRLTADNSEEMLKLQLDTLDKTIAKQEEEILRFTDICNKQADEAAKSMKKMKDDYEVKLDKLTKAHEAANRDRESAVMRYAMSEKELIDQKKERDSLDKRLKEANREKDILVSKLKGLTNDKSRVCQILDVKCNELAASQKESERLKECINSREIKIKWTQNKLQTELEVNKEVQAKVETLTKKLLETREEADQVRKDCQAMMKAYQVSEENKAYLLEQQLKELQAQLIMERHDHQDKEESFRQLQLEVDALKKKHQLILNENNQLSIKVQHLEKERLEYEQNLSKLKRTMDEQKQNVVDLHGKLAEMESLRIQLQHEQEKLSASQSEVERLRQSNAELQQDMATCREKEAELLEFTQKLTDKNVRLQSEFSATEAKAEELEFVVGPQTRHIAELEARVASLTDLLNQEKQLRNDENQLLARHLAEKTQRADSLNQQLEDQKGENQVLKRKQIAALKELTRELHQTRKRLEQYESPSGSSSIGPTSRASSSTSLNNIEPSSTSTIPVPVKINAPSQEISSNGVEPNEPDKQTLIEHIIKLQRANARKAEKLEFMEEHAQQLVAELQKKTRVLQSYILREQCGALASDTMDQNKAEVTRHGGIMASVYGSRAVDDTMTFELSLEINHKLQAVLEDTLLKNITLKNNIDTLGDEISRLQNELREKPC